ncbi:MAG: winged helix-turn-helix transcriptional regulator [Limnochordaceae bacterium]|nr:winged helix-turn-helix transcriptional regulator [Limnochordaceae bacterium]
MAAQHADSVAAQVAAGLVKLSLALRHEAWKEARGGGLTPTQGQVLSWLLLQAPGQCPTPGELAKALALSPATVSEALRTLEAKGLVRRRQSGDDRRSFQLALTGAGSRIAQASAGWADFLAVAVDSLPPADQVALLRVLVRLIRTLQLQGKISVARMCVSCTYFRPFAHPDPERPHHCHYVDAAFGDGRLRLECPDYEPAPDERQEAAWEAWAGRWERAAET